MEIGYLLSDHFDYSKMICNDAGPEYAKSMGWQSIYLSNFQVINNNIVVYVIDNRVTEKDKANIDTIISNNKSIIFFFKIVDPYFEQINNFWYIPYLFEKSYLVNVFFLSNYTPTEITLFLDKLTKGKKLIHLPYPYDSNRERSLLLKKRKYKVIISGAINEHIYPYRAIVWGKTRRSPVRIFTKVLQHPGYADIGNDQIHSIVKESYIDYLSQFKFMLVTPSRAKLEFLKYNECGYAGCLPVGLPPDSYPKEVKELFYFINPNSVSTSICKLMFMADNEIHYRVEAFRSFLRAQRNQMILNETFADFLKRVLCTT